MKTIELNLYTPLELQTKFPDGFKHAFEEFQQRVHSDPCPAWRDETLDSFRACITHTTGLTLEDWSIGAYSQNNFCRVRFGNGPAGDFTGRRACAWLENNLLGPLRLPWYGHGDRTRHYYRTLNNSYRGCGDCRPYCPGLVRPCPFTGYCADDDMIDALLAAVRKGRTLKDAFQSLADVTADLLEKDLEDSASERAFLESNDLYKDNGERF